MSLLMDTLKKMKRGKKSKPVPPNLKSTKKDSKIRYIVLGSVAFLLSASLVLLYVFQDIFLYQGDNLLVKQESVKKGNVQAEKKAVIPEKIKNVSEEKIKHETKTEENNPPVEKHKKTFEEQKTQPEQPPPKTEKKPSKEQNPYLYSTYISLANQYLDKHQYEKSLEYYIRAYSIQPSENLLKNIIILQIYTGKEEDAVKNLNKIRNEKFLSDILLSLIEKGKTDIVKDFLEKNIKDRNSADLHYVAGILQEKSGNTAKALFHYKKAFELNPSDPYIAYAYARILEISGKPSTAVNIYRHITELPETDNELKEIAVRRIKALGGNYE